MANDRVEIQDELNPWFELKRSEFAKEGYPYIDTENLKTCFSSFIWKHHMPVQYYQQVFEILHFTVNQYFDYESLQAQVYKVAPLNEINFEDFF